MAANTQREVFCDHSHVGNWVLETNAVQYKTLKVTDVFCSLYVLCRSNFPPVAIYSLQCA